MKKYIYTSAVALKEKRNRQVKKSKGLCWRNGCDERAMPSKTKCAYHLNQMAVTSRNHYRKRVGIPLDAPLHTRAAKC